MNRQEFEANWRQLAPKITAKWNKVTMEELNRLDGKYEPFLGQLQRKYAYSREQAENEMRAFSTTSAEVSGKIEQIGSSCAPCSDHKGQKTHKEKKRKAS